MLFVFPLYVNDDVEVSCDVVTVVKTKSWHIPRGAYVAFFVEEASLVAQVPTQVKGTEDGGINAETSELVREAGANVLVAGSAIYCAPDVAQAIKAIRG